MFQVQDIPELCLTAIRLSHDVTNADYVHLARDDGNNVFAYVWVTFIYFSSAALLLKIEMIRGFNILVN